MDIYLSKLTKIHTCVLFIISLNGLYFFFQIDIVDFDSTPLGKCVSNTCMYVTIVRVITFTCTLWTLSRFRERSMKLAFPSCENGYTLLNPVKTGCRIDDMFGRIFVVVRVGFCAVELFQVVVLFYWFEWWMQFVSFYMDFRMECERKAILISMECIWKGMEFNFTFF